MKSLENQAHDARVRNGPGGATNATPTLTDNPNVGGSGMAAEANITPEGDSATNSMNASLLPDAEELRRLFSYNQETGLLSFNKRSACDFERSTSPEKSARHFNETYAGKEITAQMPNGYVVCRIEGKTRFAHRVIWKIVHGEDPDVIDHINGDPSDNRICNLRSVRQKINSRNSRIRSNNKSGISGIWEKKPKAWGARWLVVESEDCRIIKSKSMKCFGAAVKHRNNSLRSRGFSPMHGIRGFSDDHQSKGAAQWM